ncbi:alanine racemase [Klebsiella pneumoniae]|uniref:Alanine racemase n=1 Tax=Klebsiella pneumoniae TaxID=573 RepID=A0A378BVU1_KLEPN|nr:alanine racemase [Klebsiella pneumoniae]
MTRPVVASIDLLALRQNLQIVRRAAPGSRLWRWSRPTPTATAWRAYGVR